MYRVNVLSKGIHANFVLGYRYILTKKDTLSFIEMLEKYEVDYDVEKFIHITKSIFAWSSTEADEKLFG